MSVPDAKGLGAVGSKEELDPELLELPDPPKKQRTLTLVLLALTAVASLFMVSALSRDALYAFSPKDPVDIGDLWGAKPAGVGENRLVSGRGMLGASGAVRYERPFESDSYRLAPVAGRTDLWVEIRVPSGEETARFVPPSTFYGRLVRFENAGPRHRGLRDRVPAGAWLLVDGETPDRARWAIGLMTLFLGFAVWNVFAFARLVKKVH